MPRHYSAEVQNVIACSREIARAHRLPAVSSACLLLALLQAEDAWAQKYLMAAGVTADAVKELIPAQTAEKETPQFLPFAPEVKRHLEAACRAGRELGRGAVSTGHLLLGLFTPPEGPIVQFLQAQGLNPAEIERDMPPSSPPEELRPSPMESEGQFAVAPGRRHASLFARSDAAVREHVISVRLDDASMAGIDALIKADIFKSRSEAAHYLIKKGLTVQAELLAEVNKRLAAIEEIQAELRRLFHEQP